MIYGEPDIREAVQSGEIGVEPQPDESAHQPASLDVALGSEFYDPVTDRYSYDDVELPSGVRVLAHTEETLSLPNDVAAQITGRSSIGRKGIIVHKTAGWIDPGFSGQVTLELKNLGNQFRRLDSGDRIAQVVFFPLKTESDGYDGHYQNQTGATESQL